MLGDMKGFGYRSSAISSSETGSSRGSIGVVVVGRKFGDRNHGRSHHRTRKIHDRFKGVGEESDRTRHPPGESCQKEGSKGGKNRRPSVVFYGRVIHSGIMCAGSRACQHHVKLSQHLPTTNPYLAFINKINSRIARTVFFAANSPGTQSRTSRRCYLSGFGKWSARA
jgi:hypothetical protein